MQSHSPVSSANKLSGSLQGHRYTLICWDHVRWSLFLLLCDVEVSCITLPLWGSTVIRLTSPPLEQPGAFQLPTVTIHLIYPPFGCLTDTLPGVNSYMCSEQNQSIL